MTRTSRSRFIWNLAGVVLAISQLHGAEDALPTVVAANDANIRYMGRWDFKDPAAPRCNWPGCSVQAKFSGPALQAKLNFNGKDQFQIVIDGKPTGVLKPVQGQQVYTLAQGLSDGEHAVELFKRTETFGGKPQFLGFHLAAGRKLLPLPPRPNRRIELVGDSITCGYGNQAPNQNEKFSLDTENNYMAYGAIAARAIQAEYHCIAYSGRKMWPDNTVPEIYGRIVADEPGSTWDFAKYVPDAVIVNLGTNDFGKGIPDEKGWTGAYKEFIARVRKHAPQAHVYCAVGSMMSDSYPANQKHLTTIRAYLTKLIGELNAAGDKKIHYLEFEPQNMNTDGIGADWHPSIKTNEKMAAKLAEALKRDLGW